MKNPTSEDIEAFLKHSDRAYATEAANAESRRRAREWVEQYEAERKAKRAEREKRRDAK